MYQSRHYEYCNMGSRIRISYEVYKELKIKYYTYKRRMKIMSNLRKLERNVLMSKCYAQNGNTSKFKDEWNTYRTEKFGDKVPVDTMPKKKRFLDKKDEFIGALRYQKAMIQNYMAQKKAEREAAENVAEVTE